MVKNIRLDGGLKGTLVDGTDVDIESIWFRGDLGETHVTYRRNGETHVEIRSSGRKPTRKRIY